MWSVDVQYKEENLHSDDKQCFLRTVLTVLKKPLKDQTFQSSACIQEYTRDDKNNTFRPIA